MSFTHYFPLTINDSLVSGTPGAGFRSLIAKTHDDLRSVANGGLVAQADGGDIALYASDGTTQLPFELVGYNPATGAVLGWGLINCADGLVVRLYVGDAGIANQSNPEAVWDHFCDHLEDGTTLAPVDASGVHGSGSVTGAVAAAGKVGGGASFDASGDYIEYSDHADFDPSTLCLRCWVNPTNFGASGEIVAHGNDTDGWYVEVQGGGIGSDGKLAFATDAFTVSNNVILSSGVLQYLVVVHNGTNDLYYVNGVLVDTKANANPITNYAGALVIGAWISHDFGFLGVIDEIRISNSEPSADVIATEYENQDDPDSFWTLGSATAAGGGAATNPVNAGAFDRHLIPRGWF